jgi:hypothetical protein
LKERKIQATDSHMCDKNLTFEQNKGIGEIERMGDEAI